MGHYNHEGKNQFWGRRWPLLQRKARIIQTTKPSSPECVKAPRKKGYSVTHDKSPCPCCLSGICGKARRWRPGSLHALTWKSARSLSRLSSLVQRHRRQRYAPREVYCWRTSVYNCPFQSLCQWCSHSVFLLVSKSVNAFVTSNRHSHVCWIRADEKDRRLRIKMLLKCRCSLYACVCSATAVAVK